MSSSPKNPTRAFRNRRFGFGRIIRRRLLSVASIITVLFLWWLVTAVNLVEPLFLPKPSAVWQAFVSTSTEGYRGLPLWEHLAISMRRVLIGFGSAIVVAVPLGVLVGSSETIEALVEPLINFYRPLPPLAYYTILIVWLGIGETAKDTLLFLAAFPILFISTIGGVSGVRQERIDAARSLGANKWQTLRYVTFPSTLPSIFTGMRVAIAATYTTLVAAELVAAQAGLGWMVLNAARFLQTDVVFMGIIVIGITGVLLDSLVKLAQRKFVPWLGKA